MGELSTMVVVGSSRPGSTVSLPAQHCYFDALARSQASICRRGSRAAIELTCMARLSAYSLIFKQHHHIPERFGSNLQISRSCIAADQGMVLKA